MIASKTLITSLVKEDHGDGSWSTTLNGVPWASGLVEAVVDEYESVTGRPPLPPSELENLVGMKVTLLRAATNMLGGGSIEATEGKLFEGQVGLGLLPKGARKRGFRVDPAKVLDVLVGWDEACAQRLVDQVRDRFPKLREVTQDRLNVLPGQYDDGRSHDCTLAVFGTYRTPEGDATASVWLCSEYDSESDIVDGVLIVKGAYGVSEHGSIFGRDLLRMHAGEVVDWLPCTFKAANELCDLSYDDAYAELQKRWA